MAWIESHDEIWDHWKLMKLCEATGLEDTNAVGKLHSLWHFTLRNAWRDANLEPWGEEGIERAARWRGQPGVFIGALRACGFMDNFTVRGFIKRAGRLVYDRLRKEEYRKSAVKRRTSGGQSKATVPYPTVPYPTVPYPTVPIPPLPPGAFESLWNLYPRKLGKDAAAKCFKAQVKTPEDFENIKKALAHFTADLRKKETTEEFIPHGSTWFNKRWHDWINFTGPPEKTPPSAVPSILSLSAIEKLADPVAREAALRLREEKLKEVPK